MRFLTNYAKSCDLRSIMRNRNIAEYQKPWIMVSSCTMLSNCVWLQIIFCTCFSPSCDRSCVKIADRFTSLGFSVKKQTRWSNGKTIVLVSNERYLLWCVYDGRAPRTLFVHMSGAPYQRNLRNFGNHVTVRLPIHQHHREANEKCQTFKLVWEPVICV